MPPPSSIKVVKGRPEPQPRAPTPRAPSRGLQTFEPVPPPPGDDLFAEEPTPKPELYRPLPASEPSGDLFAPERPDPDAHLFVAASSAGDDLFQDEPTPPSRSRPGLFPPPSDRSDEETVGSGDQIRLEELVPDLVVPKTGDLPQEVEPEALEPIGILQPDPLYEPPAPSPIDPDERTLAEPPAMVPPDYEPINMEVPVFADWDGATNDDVLLVNPPVIPEVEVPEIPDLGSRTRDEEGATTLMVSRHDLFVEPLRDDLVRWGDERPVLDSHPEFSAAETPDLQPDGEALPLASHSMVNLRAPSPTDLAEARAKRNDAAAARPTAFHRTLAALRAQAERADLPDRDALLGAIDLLERHAYVRAALAKIERDDPSF